MLIFFDNNTIPEDCSPFDCFTSFNNAATLCGSPMLLHSGIYVATPLDAIFLYISLPVLYIFLKYSNEISTIDFKL